MSRRQILGMDIGGTNIRAGLVDEDGCLTHFEMSSSTEIFCDEKQQKLRGLTQYIRRYIHRFCPGEPPCAVSIGFPSTLNKEKTVLLSTPNLPSMNNLPVVDILRSALGFPIFINRDVNLLMLHDMLEHHLSGQGITIGCYFGTGLGNAICMDGKFLSGKHGVAGELGHIPLYGVRTACGCGNAGCMETLAAGSYLTEIQQKYFPQTPIHALFSRHGDTEVLRQFVEILSLPVATEINIFDPDHIILGGGVIQMPAFPVELLMRYIRDHARKPYPCNDLDVVFSRPSQESGVIGAGLHGFMQLAACGAREMEQEVSDHDCVGV